MTFKPKPVPPASIGSVYGPWLVVALSGPTERGHRSPSRAAYRCRCTTCGAERMNRSGSLTSGWAKGCRRCELKQLPPVPAAASRKRGSPLPEIGATFGAWKVTGFTYERGAKGAIVCQIRCTCGCSSVARPSKLKVGRSLRCKSCAAKERRAKEDRPPKPIKVVPDRPKPKPMQRSAAWGVPPADQVPLPKVWNAATIHDLVEKRRGFR